MHEPTPQPEAWPDPDAPERRPVRWMLWVAVAATLLVHGAVLLLVPVPKALAFEPSERSQELRLRLEPEPEPEAPPEYVETNPDTPQNVPDETDQVSDRDQQTAQETPDRSSDAETPEVAGEEPDSRKIVEGELDQPPPLPPVPPAPQSADDPAEAQSIEPIAPPVPSREPSPLPPAPDFIEQTPESEDGPASTEGPRGEATEAPEREPDPEVLNITPPLPSVSQQQPQTSQPSEQRPQQPRPRPRLTPEVVPGPLMESTTAASRAGTIGIDARFSEYGQYASRMIEAVGRWWNEQVDRVGIGAEDRPSMVRLRFRLDSQGEIHDLEVLETSAGRLATVLCRDAVMGRAPYGPWTEDMVRTLGTETEITFTFRYR